MKDIEGFWAAEYHGPFGWEGAGFLMLEGGQVIGGGRNHYSKGTYERKGKKVTIDLSLNYFGEPRTLFGERVPKFDVHFEGKLRGKRIRGTSARPGKKVLPLEARLKYCAPVSGGGPTKGK